MGKRMSREQKWGTLIWTFGPLRIEKKKKLCPMFGLQDQRKWGGEMNQRSSWE